MNGFFITGTDTEVGKTFVTLGLMTALKKRNLTVFGMKPVASGCVLTKEGLRNEDAEQIQQLNDIEVPYEQINPYAFAPAIAPHLAAAKAGEIIELDKIALCHKALTLLADAHVVEGIGGWRVPLGDNQSTSDLVHRLGLPVILVVGMRVGCINHALLTAEAIRADGAHLQAWVANQLEPDYPNLTPTVECITSKLSAPMLGLVPFMETVDVGRISDSLNLHFLLS